MASEKVSPDPAAMPEVLILPESIRKLIGDPKIKLELHTISYSHYCERARWSLRLAHVPYVEAGRYLPLAHIPPLIKLGRRFNAAAPADTASSDSPAVTPTLAVFDSSGAPVDLIRNSALIGRFAQLHSAACHAANPDPAAAGAALYGPGLTAGDDGQSWTAAGDPELCKRIAEMELRLSNVTGVEVRRLLYWHLVPHGAIMAEMFRKNAPAAPGWWAGVLSWLNRLLLPKILKVNADTAARGRERLLAEFDYFDQVLTAQEAAAAKASSSCNGAASLPPATAAATGNGEVAAGSGSPRHNPPACLPFYLVGQSLTAADVSLAALVAPLLPVSSMGLSEWWGPSPEQLPKEFRRFCEALAARPTGRFALAMWQVHGPLAAAAASQL